MVRRHFVILVCAAALAACGDSDPAGPGGGQNGDFDVTITSGTTPTYTWPSGDQGFSVSVMRTAAPTVIVWGVADPTRTMTAPVTHGVVPPGKANTANEEPVLTAGVEYRVSITLADGRTGWKEFRP